MTAPRPAQTSEQLSQVDVDRMALVISTAAGIVMTHAAGGIRMRVTFAKQLCAYPRAMFMAGGALAAFGLLPGLPKIPFLVLGAAIAAVGRAAANAETQRDAKEAAAKNAEAPAAPTADPITDLSQIDPIELEVGHALIPLVDEKQGGDLLERISMLRKPSAQELGILVPAIRIRDDIRLPANQYVIKLLGAEIARGEVMLPFLLALDTGRVIGAVEGIDTIDPSFGMPARWIAPNRRGEAESVGYVVVEPATVVATHLMEKLKSSAADLLGGQEVQEMVDTLKKTHPALVDGVVPNKLTLGVLHRVLQRLLKERVPIRDLVTILEAVADAADQTKDPEVLTEHARRALTNTIARLHMDETGVVRGITVGPKLEMALVGLFSPRSGQNPAAMLTPDSLGALLRELDQMSRATAVEGRPIPLLAPPSLRVGLRRIVEPVLPNLPVVSLAELPTYVKLSAIATWEIGHAA
jgi:flagellar biosynthesis protein FlhA